MALRTFLHPSLIRLMVVLYLLPLCFSAALARQQKQQPQQAKKLNIAVLDFDARGGLSKEEAASLSDIFQAQLVQMGEFIVVDRNRIKALLQEQGFQQSEACSQVECIVEAGKILKVEKMFAGTIGKVGKIFNVNIQVIDIATSQIVSNRAKQHSGNIEDLASDIIPALATELAQEMTGKKIKTVVETSGGGSSWLYYVGGALLLGGGAAAALLGGKKAGGGETTQPPPTTQLPGPPGIP